jgi:hypothetical protein
MKRFVVVFFILCAAALAVLSLLKLQEADTGTAFTMPRLVPSSTRNVNTANPAGATDYGADDSLISLIALRSDEKLIQTMSADFNGDGYDDQINAIRRNGQPNIILLVGIYDARQNIYDRSDEIDTGIAQEDSFSYTCTDVTGDHRNALVYSGLASNGDSIMQIILARGGAQSYLQLTTIGDFRTNGTVSLQQIDRYDSYESLQAAGMSFPVWVYSVDTGVNNTLDQLQTMYEWNPASGRYVQARQTRIAGQRLASSELVRIQNGTVGSFAAYVDGTWYQVANDTPDIRYIFFDYEAKEIIFLYEDMQEVYSWSSSAIRRNGAYLSTVNTGIANLARQFDVSITGSDEITVRVQDDVRMKINEDSLWNGVYKKFTPTLGFTGNPRKSNADEVIAVLTSEPQWNLSDGTQVQFTDSGYAVQSNSGADNGRFFILYIGDNPVIQFRSAVEQPFFESAYAISKNTGTDGKNSYLMEPVSVLSSGYEKKEKPSVRLESVFIDENAATDN